MGNDYRLTFTSLYVGTIVGLITVFNPLIVQAGFLNGEKYLTCNGKDSNEQAKLQKERCFQDPGVIIDLNPYIGNRVSNKNSYSRIQIPAHIKDIADDVALTSSFHLNVLKEHLNEISILHKVVLKTPNVNDINNSFVSYGLYINYGFFRSLPRVPEDEYRNFIINFNPSGKYGLDTGLFYDENEPNSAELNSIYNHASYAHDLRELQYVDAVFNKKYTRVVFPQKIIIKNGLFYAPLDRSSRIQTVYTIDDAGGKLFLHGLRKKYDNYGINAAEIGLYVTPSTDYPSRISFVTNSPVFRTGDIQLDRIFVLPINASNTEQSLTYTHIDGIDILGPVNTTEEYIESWGVSFGFYRDDMPQMLMSNPKENFSYINRTYIYMNSGLHFRQVHFKEDLDVNSIYNTERAKINRHAVDFGEYPEYELESGTRLDGKKDASVVLKHNAVEIENNIIVDRPFAGLVSYSTNTFLYDYEVSDLITLQTLSLGQKLPDLKQNIADRSNYFVPFNLLTTHPKTKVDFRVFVENEQIKPSLVSVFSNIAWRLPVAFAEDDYGLFLAINNHRLNYQNKNIGTDNKFALTKSHNFPRFNIKHLQDSLKTNLNRGVFLNIDFDKSFKFTTDKAKAYPLTVIYTSAHVALDEGFNDDDQIIRIVLPGNDAILYYHGSLTNSQQNSNDLVNHAPDIVVSKTGLLQYDEANASDLEQAILDNNGLTAIVFHGDRRQTNVADLYAHNFTHLPYNNKAAVSILYSKKFIGNVNITANSEGIFTLHDTVFHGELSFGISHTQEPIDQIINLGLDTNNFNDQRSVAWITSTDHFVDNLSHKARINIPSSYSVTLLATNMETHFGSNMTSEENSKPEIHMGANSFLNIVLQHGLEENENIKFHLPEIFMDDNSGLNINHPSTYIEHLHINNILAPVYINIAPKGVLHLDKFVFSKNIHINAQGTLMIDEIIDNQGGHTFNLSKLKQIKNLTFGSATGLRSTLSTNNDLVVNNVDHLINTDFRAQSLIVKNLAVSKNSSLQIQNIADLTVNYVENIDMQIGKNLILRKLPETEHITFYGNHHTINVGNDVILHGETVFRNSDDSREIADNEFGIKFIIGGNLKLLPQSSLDMYLYNFQHGDQNIIKIHDIMSDISHSSYINFPSYANISINSITGNLSLRFDNNSMLSVENDIMLSSESVLEMEKTDANIGGNVKAGLLRLTRGGVFQARDLDARRIILDFDYQRELGKRDRRYILKVDSLSTQLIELSTGTRSYQTQDYAHGVTIDVAGPLTFYHESKIIGNHNQLKDAGLFITAHDTTIKANKDKPSESYSFNIPSYTILHTHDLLIDGNVDITMSDHTELEIKHAVTNLQGDRFSINLFDQSSVVILGQNVKMGRVAFDDYGELYFHRPATVDIQGSAKIGKSIIAPTESQYATSPSVMNVGGNLFVNADLILNPTAKLTIQGNLIFGEHGFISLASDTDLTVMGDVILPDASDNKSYKFRTPEDYDEGLPGTITINGHMHFLHDNDDVVLNIGTTNHNFVINGEFRLQNLATESVNISLPKDFQVNTFVHEYPSVQSILPHIMKDINNIENHNVILSDTASAQSTLLTQHDLTDNKPTTHTRDIFINHYEILGQAILGQQIQNNDSDILLGDSTSTGTQHVVTIASNGTAYVKDSYIDALGVLQVEHMNSMSSAITEVNIDIKNLLLKYLILTPATSFKNITAGTQALMFRFDVPKGSSDSIVTYVEDHFPVRNFQTMKFSTNKVIYELLDYQNSLFGFTVSPAPEKYNFMKFVEFDIWIQSAIDTMQEAIDSTIDKSASLFIGISRDDVASKPYVLIPVQALTGHVSIDGLDLKGLSLVGIDNSNLHVDYSKEDRFWFKDSNYPIIMHHLTSKQHIVNRFDMPPQSFMRRFDGVFALFNFSKFDTTKFYFTPSKVPLNQIYYRDDQKSWDRPNARFMVFNKSNTLDYNYHTIEIITSLISQNMDQDVTGYVEILPIEVKPYNNKSVLPHVFSPIRIRVDTIDKNPLQNLDYVIPRLDTHSVSGSSWMSVLNVDGKGTAIIAGKAAFIFDMTHTVTPSHEFMPMVTLRDESHDQYTPDSYVNNVLHNTPQSQTVFNSDMYTPFLMSIGLDKGFALQNTESYGHNLSDDDLPDFSSAATNIVMSAQDKNNNKWLDSYFDKLPVLIESSVGLTIKTAKPWIVRADVSGFIPSHYASQTYHVDWQTLSQDFLHNRDAGLSTWKLSDVNKRYVQIHRSSVSADELAASRILIWRLYNNENRQNKDNLLRLILLRPHYQNSGYTNGPRPHYQNSGYMNGAQASHGDLGALYDKRRNHGFISLAGNLHNKSLFVDIGNIFFSKEYESDEKFMHNPDRKVLFVQNYNNTSFHLKDPKNLQNLYSYFPNAQITDLEDYVIPWDESSQRKLIQSIQAGFVSGLKNDNLRYIILDKSLKEALDLIENMQASTINYDDDIVQAPIVMDWFSDLFDDVEDWFEEAAKDVEDWFEEAAKDVEDWFTNLGSQFGADENLISQSFQRMRDYNQVLNNDLLRTADYLPDTQKPNISLLDYITNRLKNQSDENLDDLDIIDNMIDNLAEEVQTHNFSINELEMLRDILLSMSNTMLNSRSILQKKYKAVVNQDNTVDFVQNWESYVKHLLTFDTANKLQLDIDNIRNSDQESLEKITALEEYLLSTLAIQTINTVKQKVLILQNLQDWQDWRAQSDTQSTQSNVRMIDQYNSKDLTFDLTGVGQFTLFNDHKTLLVDSSIYLSLKNTKDNNDPSTVEPLVSFIAQGPFLQINKNNDDKMQLFFYEHPYQSDNYHDRIRFELLSSSDDGFDAPNVYFASMNSQSVFDATLFIGAINPSANNVTEIKLAGGKFNNIVLHAGHSKLYLYLQDYLAPTEPGRGGKVFLSSYRDGSSNFIDNLDKFSSVNDNQKLNIGDGVLPYELHFDVHGPKEVLHIPQGELFDVDQGYDLDITSRTKIEQYWPRSTVKSGATWSFSSMMGDPVYINIRKLPSQDKIQDNEADIVIESQASIISRGSKYLQFDHSLHIDGLILFVDDYILRENQSILGEIQHLLSNMNIDKDAFLQSLVRDPSEIMSKIFDHYQDYIKSHDNSIDSIATAFTSTPATGSSLYHYNANYHQVQNDYLSEWLKDVKQEFVNQDSQSYESLVLELDQYQRQQTNNFSITPVHDFADLGNINIIEAQNVKLRRHSLMILHPQYHTKNLSLKDTPPVLGALTNMNDCLSAQDSDCISQYLYESMASHSHRNVLKPIVVPMMIIKGDFIDENDKPYTEGIISVFVGSDIPKGLVPEYAHESSNIYMNDVNYQKFLTAVTKYQDVALPKGLILFSLYNGHTNPRSIFDVDEDDMTANIVIPQAFQNDKILFAVYSDLFTVPSITISEAQNLNIYFDTVIHDVQSIRKYRDDGSPMTPYTTPSDQGYYHALFSGSVVRKSYLITAEGSLNINTQIDTENVDKIILQDVIGDTDFQNKHQFKILDPANHPFVSGKSARQGKHDFHADVMRQDFLQKGIFMKDAIFSFSRVPQQMITHDHQVMNLNSTKLLSDEWLQLDIFHINGDVNHQIEIINSKDNLSIFVDMNWEFVNPVLAYVPVIHLGFYNNTYDDSNFVHTSDALLFLMNYHAFTSEVKKQVCDNLPDQYVTQKQTKNNCLQVMSKTKISSSITHPMSLYAFRSDVLFNTMKTKDQADHLSNINLYTLPILGLDKPVQKVLNFVVSSKIRSTAPVVFNFQGNVARGVETDHQQGFVVLHINQGSIVSDDVIKINNKKYTTYNYLFHDPTEDHKRLLTTDLSQNVAAPDDRIGSWDNYNLALSAGLNKIKFGSAVFNFDTYLQTFSKLPVRILNSGSILLERQMRPDNTFADALTNVAINLNAGGIFESTGSIQGGSIIAKSTSGIILHDTDAAYKTDILFLKPDFASVIYDVNDDLAQQSSSSYLILDNVNFQGKVFWDNVFSKLNIQIRGKNKLETMMIFSNVALAAHQNIELNFSVAAKSIKDPKYNSIENNTTIWSPQAFVQDGNTYYIISDAMLMKQEDLQHLSDFYLWSLSGHDDSFDFDNNYHDVVMMNDVESLYDSVLNENETVMNDTGRARVDLTTKTKVAREVCSTLALNVLSGQANNINCDEIMIDKDIYSDSSVLSLDLDIQNHNLVLPQAGSWATSVNITIDNKSSMQFGEMYQERLPENKQELRTVSFAGPSTITIKNGGSMIVSGHTHVNGLKKIHIEKNGKLIFDVHDTHIYGLLDNLTDVTIEDLSDVIIRVHKHNLDHKYVVPLFNLSDDHYEKVQEISDKISVEIVDAENKYPGIRLVVKAANNGDAFLNHKRQAGLINHVTQPLQSDQYWVPGDEDNLMIADVMDLVQQDPGIPILHNVYPGYHAIVLDVDHGAEVFAVPVLFTSYYQWNSMLGTDSSYLGSVISNSHRHKTNRHVFNVWGDIYYSRQSLADTEKIPVFYEDNQPYKSVSGAVMGAHFKFDDNVRIGLSVGASNSRGRAPSASGIFQSIKHKAYDLDINFQSHSMQFGGDMQYQDHVVHWLGMVGLYLNKNQYSRSIPDTAHRGFMSKSHDHALMIHSRFGGSWDLTGQGVLWTPEIFFTLSRIHFGVVNELLKLNDDVANNVKLFYMNHHVNYLNNFGIKMSLGKELRYKNIKIQWSVYTQGDVTAYSGRELALTVLSRTTLLSGATQEQQNTVTNPKLLGLGYQVTFGIDLNFTYNDVFDVNLGYSLGVDKNSRINVHNLKLSFDFII